MAVEKPNILLIIADDMGIDTFHVDDANDTATVQLSTTDAYPLPNLSRLIATGVHFTRAWAQPICAPTRATLFTGLHPWKTRIGDAAGDPILSTTLPSDDSIDIQTLANCVADAGYQCAIFGKWDLGDDHQTGVPTARGWHRHEGILAGGLRFIDQNPPNKKKYEELIQQDVRYASWDKVVGDAHLDMVRENIKPEERTHMYATADQVFGARDWIKQVEGQPWWVTLSLFSPHDPFHVPPKDTFTITFKDPDNPTIQEMFVAMAESMDHYLGKLFDDPSPEIQNQLKNTIILFMGDNGSQDELDLIEGDDKSSVYIGGVHVPMIIADGGAMFGDGPCYFDADRASSEKQSMVHIVDVFQTIIDMAGGAPPQYPTDSISMLPYLRDTAQDARFADWQARAHTFGQFFVPSNIPPLAGRYYKLGECATISDGTYKLNYQKGRFEFSELTFDPATDLTTEHVTNDFTHPQALALWQALTTPGSPQYAEVDGRGRKFPLLPGLDKRAYRYVRLVSLSEVNGNPWACVAEFNLLDDAGNLLDRTKWRASADSEDTANGYVAKQAIDGSPSPHSFWHTVWQQDPPPHPHELRIDLGAAYKLRGFKYLPRQGLASGRIANYQFFVSQDSTNWILLASGTFPNTTEEQTVTFKYTEPIEYFGELPPDPLLDIDTFALHLHGDSYKAGDVWEDDSGRNNHATRADSCTMPLLHQVTDYNNKSFKVMRFHSGSGLVLPDEFDLQAPCTVMIVDRYYDMLKGRTLQGRNTDWLLGKWNGQNGCYMGSWLHSESYFAVDKAFTISTATLDENHTGTYYLNGEQAGRLEGATAPGQLAFAKGGFYSGDVSEADIAAVLIWQRVLSNHERQEVEQWLGYRYGVVELKGGILTRT